MKKSQISFEFIMIFSLILISLVILMYMVNQRLSGIDEQQEDLLMQNLANNIISEVELASSVNNNYLRRFSIPPVINGKDYTMNIEDNILYIKIYENDLQVNYMDTALPVPVKGTFIEEITFNTTEHCITKTRYDGIRIARNQAGLDTSVKKVSPGQKFSVVVSLNCVENIRSTQFTIKYDSTIFKVLKNSDFRPITQQNSPGSNALFESLLPSVYFDFTDKYLTPPSTDYPYNDPDIARHTYAFIGSNCASGSGLVANITFEVKSPLPPSHPAQTVIQFDPDFLDSELLVLDCTTNKYTKEGLPDSKTSVKINID